MQNFAERLVLALAEAHCEFVIVGGLSAVLQGAPIVTQDLDVCYRRTPDNLARIAAALKPFGLKLRNLPEGLPNIFDEHSLALGTNFTLTMTGAGIHKDKNYKTKTGAIALAISAPEPMVEVAATNKPPAAATPPPAAK